MYEEQTRNHFLCSFKLYYYTWRRWRWEGSKFCQHLISLLKVGNRKCQIIASISHQIIYCLNIFYYTKIIFNQLFFSSYTKVTICIVLRTLLNGIQCHISINKSGPFITRSSALRLDNYRGVPSFPLWPTKLRMLRVNFMCIQVHFFAYLANSGSTRCS